MSKFISFIGSLPNQQLSNIIHKAYTTIYESDEKDDIIVVPYSTDENVQKEIEQKIDPIKKQTDKLSETLDQSKNKLKEESDKIVSELQK